LNGNSEAQTLNFEVRAPWRRSNDKTREVFNERIEALSPGKDLTARELYIERNIIP
jgi:hypothetical protein